EGDGGRSDGFAPHRFHGEAPELTDRPDRFARHGYRKRARRPRSTRKAPNPPARTMGQRSAVLRMGRNSAPAGEISMNPTGLAPIPPPPPPPSAPSCSSEPLPVPPPKP